ncbi:hypothetical protein PTTG_12484 [Puccinia triticina 1-1 BBBD Race 1]|uniref:N-acetyltransferase ECO1 n=1 Tax=Puccinia triticina (isolate 1-1 / race 1 (BBBD)) TaxID=630390 RepID=A0A180GE20_PUCT1|nr:hypothetical protein PTTG_12484 [Puccinia triticina 1-1 BBBD Race 1]
MSTILPSFDTPPTRKRTMTDARPSSQRSPEAAADPQDLAPPPSRVRVVVPVPGRTKTASGSGDIRSFFGPATAPSARQNDLPTSSPATTVLGPSSSSSSATTVPRASTTTTSSPATTVPRASSDSAGVLATLRGPKRAQDSATNSDRKKKGGGPLAQLTLDLSSRPTTQICKECGMSFVIGVQEDVELHERHHRGVVAGVEWPFGETGECRTVWRAPGGLGSEQIVKVSLEPASLRRSRYKHKVEQVLEMVDRSLDAQALTAEQRRASTLYLYLGEPTTTTGRAGEGEPRKRRKRVVVKGMCVAARIEEGYRIVGGPDSVEDDAGLLRFGETSSELYCSPRAEKTLVGIHRIWSAPGARRAGLGLRLLDAVALTFIYGMAIEGAEMRRGLVAFSQPTESGLALAAAWFGSVFFKIFID